MKVKTTKLERKKPIRIIYWILIIFFLGAAVFFGRNSFVQMALKKREVAKLQAKVEQLRTENDSLRKQNHELRTNPAVIEKNARERLGYQKSGETVYRFIPPPPSETDKKQKR